MWVSLRFLYLAFLELLGMCRLMFSSTLGSFQSLFLWVLFLLLSLLSFWYSHYTYVGLLNCFPHFWDFVLLHFLFSVLWIIRYIFKSADSNFCQFNYTIETLQWILHFTNCFFRFHNFDMVLFYNFFLSDETLSSYLPVFLSARLPLVLWIYL